MMLDIEPDTYKPWFYSNNDCGFVDLLTADEEELIIRVIHVHALQNLYFSLVGFELNIKQ